MKITTLKIAIMGDSDAVKVEFIKQVTKQHFSACNGPTIGADFTISEYEAADQEMHLYIWDLIGHPSFSALRRYYLHGADVFVIVVDASSPEGASRVADWVAEASSANPGATGVIVAANADLAPDRAAAMKAIEAVAARLGIKAVFAVGATSEGGISALRGIVSCAVPSIDVSGLRIKA